MQNSRASKLTNLRPYVLLKQRLTNAERNEKKENNYYYLTVIIGDMFTRRHYQLKKSNQTM